MHANACQTTRSWPSRGENLCARGPMPAPLRPPHPTWCPGEQGRGPISGRGLSPCLQSERVPLGRRRAPTAPRSARSSLPPPRAPARGSPRKQLSSPATWLLRWEATPADLYRSGSSLGNVVRVPGRCGARGAGWDYNSQHLPGALGGAPSRRAWGAGAGLAASAEQLLRLDPRTGALGGEQTGRPLGTRRPRAAGGAHWRGRS